MIYVRKTAFPGKLILPVVLILLSAQMMQGQVLISLIFGDKLNSPTLKFGLDGGLNLASVSNLDGSKLHPGFNLGFYFDFLIKKDTRWYIHTGVLVKSPMGADQLDPYPLENADSAMLNPLFANGSVDRQFRYFNVPVLVRYLFKNNLFVEAGPMLGLLYKARDKFTTKVENDKDLSFDNKVIGQYNRIDAGAMGGIGYHLAALNGMNLGIRYYQGLTDIVKNNAGPAQRNASLYFFASIPIGAGEKAQAKKAARKQQ